VKKIAFLIVTFFPIGCGGGGEGGGDALQGNGGTPIAKVSAPSLISQTGATLNGNVNPNGLATEAWFEYGTDPALSTFMTTEMQLIGDGSVDVPVGQSVNGRIGGTVYYFRVCGVNTKGTTKSTIANFTTSSLGADPTVATLAATGATLNANVTPNGLATTAWFEWGTAPALTTYTTTPEQQVGSGTTSLLVNAALSGVSTGTTYYYRVAASKSSGTSRMDVGGTVLATGKDSLDQDVSLNTWNGTSQQLCVTAGDYANQETRDCRTVYVESSARSSKKFSRPPHPIRLDRMYNAGVLTIQEQQVDVIRNISYTAFRNIGWEGRHEREYRRFRKRADHLAGVHAEAPRDQGGRRPGCRGPEGGAGASAGCHRGVGHLHGR